MHFGLLPWTQGENCQGVGFGKARSRICPACPPLDCALYEKKHPECDDNDLHRSDLIVADYDERTSIVYLVLLNTFHTSRNKIASTES
jgi:hypothetical protein